MASEIRFEPGLYRGAAGYYERFRLRYPDAMISDLARRAAQCGGVAVAKVVWPPTVILGGCQRVIVRSQEMQQGEGTILAPCELDR